MWRRDEVLHSEGKGNWGVGLEELENYADRLELA